MLESYITGIIAANAALLMGYVAYVVPMTEKRIIKRRQNLENEFLQKTKNIQKIDEIQSFCEETRKIEIWKKTLGEVLFYIIASICLSIIGVFLNYLPQELQQLADGFVFASLIMLLIEFIIIGFHLKQIHEWEVSTR